MVAPWVAKRYVVIFTIFCCRKKEISVEPTTYLHRITELPVLSQPKQKLRAQDYFNVLLNPQLAKVQICSRVPFSVNCNGIFVVDLNSVKDVRDVLVDDMGVWQWKGSYLLWKMVKWLLLEKVDPILSMLINSGCDIMRIRQVRMWRNMLYFSKVSKYSAYLC